MKHERYYWIRSRANDTKKKIFIDYLPCAGEYLYNSQRDIFSRIVELSNQYIQKSSNN